METKDVDILVVGSGAGGLTSAIAADQYGAEALVIEKSAEYGGTSATSGGGIWIPCNHLMAEAGETDSKEAAFKYMRAIIGDEVSDERIMRYVEEAPKMLKFMEDNSDVKYDYTNYSDYFPELEGGKDGYRTLDPTPYNAGKLGLEAYNKLREPHPGTIFGGFTISVNEAQTVITRSKGWQWILGKQFLAYWLDIPYRLKTKKHKRLALGNALVGRALKSCLDRDIPIWLNTGMKSLVTDDKGAVTGVIAEQNGKDIRINARKGVILAAGGFESNPEMRAKYLPGSPDPNWSATPGTNKGDSIKAAKEIGADLSLMDAAWWGPSVKVPGEDRSRVLFAERALPGIYIINHEGKRYLNEAASYDVVGRQIQEFPDTTWVVFDRTARTKYAVGPVLPAQAQPDMRWGDGLKQIVHKADTLEELADKMGVDKAGLLETAEKVNRYSETGVDEDFKKGADTYDRYYGDPTVEPNPCLGPLAKPPFYGYQLRPGDIGTKGGISVDVNAQALKDDGSVISGLYATGNNASSVMGHSYPGAGSTLGPAMTFGYVAVKHALGINT